MIARGGGPLLAGLAVAALCAAHAGAAAAAMLRSAEAHIVMHSPTSCEVSLTLAMDGGTEVEHRIEVHEGSRVGLLDVRGASQMGDLRTIGRTLALVLAPEASSYTLRYTVQQPPNRSGRCPLWVPTVPTNGRARPVRLAVRLPANAAAVGTMPGFAWTGPEGTATVGHLPAFVHVPFAWPGTPAPWDIARIMDVVAVATLVGATVAWGRRRTR